MAKILEFKRVKQQPEPCGEIDLPVDDLGDSISAIVNDCALTPANRRWLLENMLMDIDDKLVEYKLELERAETKLDQLVQAAEGQIEAAYSEYLACVTEMTKSVEILTQPTREGQG